MKSKLVLAALMASLALVALLAPGTAAATVFCEEDKAPCPETKRWKSGTALDFTTSQIFTFAFRWPEDPDWIAFEGCQSTLATTIKAAGGASSTVTSETGSLTWSACTQANQDTLSAGELEFHAIEGTTNATVTVKNLKIRLTSEPVKCVLTSGPSAHFGTLTSSGTGDAVLHVDTILVPESFGGCWNPEIRMTGAYTLAKPTGTPLFVKSS